MGWTWEEYQSQPEGFVTVLLEKFAAENRLRSQS